LSPKEFGSRVVLRDKRTVTDDEAGLVERSLGGDLDAFETLIRRYQRMVYSLAYRMTGSAADAEDLTQETFIRAHTQLAAFRGNAGFSSWLYRIAVNQCLDWLKRAERRQRLDKRWELQRRDMQPAEDALAERIQEALLQLSPKQRAAIALTVYQGLSHAEAAQALGCSETTISWRLFTARSKLKRLLQDLGRGRFGV
jgi:RNA polymerase sigma-70 factor (ECF subfamily)